MAVFREMFEFQNALPQKQGQEPKEITQAKLLRTYSIADSKVSVCWFAFAEDFRTFWGAWSCLLS